MTEPRLQRGPGGLEGLAQEGQEISETIFPRQLKLHRISELVAGPLHAWRERMSPTFTRVGHYCAGHRIVPSIDPPSLRSDWRESPPGTAHILADVVD